MMIPGPQGPGSVGPGPPLEAKGLKRAWARAPKVWAPRPWGPRAPGHQRFGSRAPKAWAAGPKGADPRFPWDSAAQSFKGRITIGFQPGFQWGSQAPRAQEAQAEPGSHVGIT